MENVINEKTSAVINTLSKYATIGGIGAGIIGGYAFFAAGGVAAAVMGSVLGATLGLGAGLFAVPALAILGVSLYQSAKNLPDTLQSIYKILRNPVLTTKDLQKKQSAEIAAAVTAPVSSAAPVAAPVTEGFNAASSTATAEKTATTSVATPAATDKPKV
jgi:hypothetical protein